MLSNNALRLKKNALRYNEVTDWAIHKFGFIDWLNTGLTNSNHSNLHNLCSDAPEIGKTPVA